ncbi:hypothetical protein PLICRDRAFT_173615 [Plicaturopsis crispa FD-325 SS-3]|nr:hypothetical protein PLICRDRAFT_173615 [Plicaturopsis crispa FD-325 SS-3]
MAVLKSLAIFVAFVATAGVTAHPAATTTSAKATLTFGPGPVCLPEGRQCGLPTSIACCPGLSCVSDPPLLIETCKPVA